MKIQIAPITANESHDLFQSFKNSLANANPSRAILSAGFAYATLGGVEEFVSHARPIKNWNGIQKQFLIGIHHAITEPSALDMLIKTNNSQARIFIPGNRLTIGALASKPLFHPKVLAITSKSGRDVRFLQAGSANMTSSATGVSPQNYEFSIAIQSSDNAVFDRRYLFHLWWKDLWNQSKVVDEALIEKYAAIREKALAQNPILRVAAETPSSIATANDFFAEVGAGSGPPGFRHQIEFPESLANFFGPVTRYRRDLTLRRKHKSWSGRPLSYKETTFGVEIWRLGMPTQVTGGEAIAERVIKFTRTSDADTFDFEVIDVGSRKYKEWIRIANMEGHLGSTHGQRMRQYGFY